MAVLVNVIGRFDGKDLAKAQAALDGLGKQAAGPTSRGFGKLATVAAITGGAIALRFGVQSVKAYAEAEASQARLTAAYSKFPALADTNIDALRALNSELQRKTRFDDDQTAAAQAVLAQFKLTGTQIAKLTPLVQDYAAATGQDVVPAAESLGKAMMGNAKALKAIGINFKASGDSAKDFETITAALRQQVGGLAEVEGKTAAGQLAILTNTFGDLQESVGEALVPALTGLVQTATPVVRVFGALPTPVRSTAIAVGVLGTAALVAGPKILSLRRELAATTIMAGKSGAAIKGAGAAFAAYAIASTAGQQLSKSVNAGTEDMAALLEQIGKTGEGADKLGFQIQGITNGTYDFNDSITRLATANGFDKFAQGLSHVLGQTDHLDLAAEAVDNVDAALADMVKAGNSDEAAKAVARLRSQFQQSGGDLATFDGAMVKYGAAVRAGVPPTAELTTEIDLSAAATKRLKLATEQLQGVLDKRAALRAWKASLASVSTEVKAASGHFGTGSVKGRAFQDWLDGSISSLSGYATSAGTAAGESQRWAEGLGSLRTKLKGMGLSKAEIDKILKPFNSMKRQAKVAGEETARGLAAGLDAKADIAIARARALGKAAALAVKDGAEVNSPSKITITAGEGLVEGIEVGVLRKAGGAKKVIRDATREILTGAESALSRFQERGRTALDFIDSVKGRITEYGSVAGFTATEGQAATAGDVLGQKTARVRQAQQFAKDIAALRKAKLNNTSLQDIIGRGVGEGGDIARALLAGGITAIRQDNALQSQLNAAATSIGDTAGLSQYGLNAAQARGLATTSVKVEKGAVVVQIGNNVTAKDRKEIEDAMDRATERLIKRIIRELRA